MIKWSFLLGFTRPTEKILAFSKRLGLWEQELVVKVLEGHYTFQMDSPRDNVVYSKKDMLNDVVKKSDGRYLLVLCSLISCSRLAEMQYCKDGSEKQSSQSRGLPPPLSCSKDSICFQEALTSSEIVWATRPLSASFLVTKLIAEPCQGLCPGLTCSLFQFCSRIPVEPIYTAVHAPCQTVVFSWKSSDWWNLFSGYCSRQLFLPNPRAQAGTRSFVWMSEQAQPQAPQ